MSDVIRLLPDSVANQIAAGEVIQRPASVVKELVENAIDAGATDIQVVLIDAGRTLVQVIDNGKGMSPTDARLAFERHATSKITCADDLYALTTKGFRGEALASFAAVAQVELKTRLAGDDVGTLLEIDGSQVMRQDVVSCPQGANFAVKNLFYNIPVRRKFLKTDKTEMSQLLAEFQRITLVHHAIAFTLKAGEQTIFDLTPASRKGRILQIFGNKLDARLIPVNIETPLITISGFVGKIDSARKRGAETYFFVNDRYMRHPYFHKAINEAFANLIPEGEQVPYFLYLTVPPENIDVNIHPTKTEIKFEHEQAIWQLLLVSVKETIGKSALIPTLDFDTENRIEIPVAPLRYSDIFVPTEPSLNTHADYDPFKSYKQHSPAITEHSIFSQTPAKHYEPDTLIEIETNEPQAQDMERAIYIGGKYILLPSDAGVMLINARRAHIRILYDKYYERLEHRTMSSGQHLLFPELIELSPVETALFNEMRSELETLGFDINHLGGNSYSINTIPVELDRASNSSPTQLLTDILHTSIESGNAPQAEIRKSIALALARTSAIADGQHLSQQEITHLLQTLFQLRSYSHAPDGSSILTLLSTTALDKLM